MRLRYTHSLRMLVALGILLLGGCADGPTAVDGEGLFTLSGTLTNRTASPVPGNTRVMVAWVVSSGSPDYTYVFGEGTVQAEKGTFRLTFDQPPPAKALNANGLGVGIVFLTTNPSLKAGMEVGESSGIIGAAGQHAVIYLAHDPATVGGGIGWAKSFQQGYNAGRGIDLPGAFDGFEPTSRSSIEIIVDALGNIKLVNWT